MAREVGRALNNSRWAFYWKLIPFSDHDTLVPRSFAFQHIQTPDHETVSPTPPYLGSMGSEWWR